MHAAHGPPRDGLTVLKEVFGYPAFRGQQADVTAHVAGGGDAFVLMPTGGGKSLCYQIPALMRDGVAVVISPLIALMEDQVAALVRRGVPAAMLNSTLSRDESARIEHGVRLGDIRFLYLSPERLVTDRCLRLLASSPLSLIAIDEAHCISEWGHDFRPEYLKLSVLHERFPAVPRIALTATADVATRAEIVRQLRLEDARVFSSSFDRPNIRYRVVEKKRTGRRQLLEYIRDEHAGETGVVYRQSRTKVEETAAFLDAHGITALPYHAGLSATERRQNQAWFLKERGVVMVATIAFGMGIDKPDVRFVAHVDVSKSVEGYYQESGRGGRDGLPAEAWMAYTPADAEPLHQMIRRSDIGDTQRRVQTAKLEAMLALCETCDCRRMRLLAYFGEPARVCRNCDTCLDPPPSTDATHAVRQLLSCVSVTGQRCDTGHVIDVLRGESTRRVMALRHHELSVFGVGRQRSVRDWQGIVRQCTALKVLAVDHAAGDVLKRTRAGNDIVHGHRRVALRAWRESGAPKRRPRKFEPAAPPGTDTLLARLRAWRLDVAQRTGIPVHMVFHDATLAAIARRRPRSVWGLRRIPGVTAAKLAAHRADILRIVALARSVSPVGLRR